MLSAYFQPVGKSFFGCQLTNFQPFYGNYIWVGKYLLGFDTVIVRDRELSSLKEKDVVNQHTK